MEKILDLPESEKLSPVTGKPLIRIGEDVSEQLAYEPGRLYAIRYIRPKYASPDRRNGAEVGVKTAPLPDGPIDRCKADVSLLSHIIVSKYCDHLPLYRQEQMFLRLEIDLPRSSRCDFASLPPHLNRSIVFCVKPCSKATTSIQTTPRFCSKTIT